VIVGLAEVCALISAVWFTCSALTAHEYYVKPRRRHQQVCPK